MNKTFTLLSLLSIATHAFSMRTPPTPHIPTPNTTPCGLDPKIAMYKQKRGTFLRQVEVEFLCFWIKDAMNGKAPFDKLPNEFLEKIDRMAEKVAQEVKSNHRIQFKETEEKIAYTSEIFKGDARYIVIQYLKNIAGFKDLDI